MGIIMGLLAVSPESVVAEKGSHGSRPTGHLIPVFPLPDPPPFPTQVRAQQFLLFVLGLLRKEWVVVFINGASRAFAI